MGSRTITIVDCDGCGKEIKGESRYGQHPEGVSAISLYYDGERGYIEQELLFCSTCLDTTFTFNQIIEKYSIDDDDDDDDFEIEDEEDDDLPF